MSMTTVGVSSGISAGGSVSGMSVVVTGANVASSVGIAGGQATAWFGRQFKILADSELVSVLIPC